MRFIERMRQRLRRQERAPRRYGSRCPFCKSDMHPEAPICVSCGRDRRRRGYWARFFKAPIVVALLAIGLPTFLIFSLKGVGLLGLSLISNQQPDIDNVAPAESTGMVKWDLKTQNFKDLIGYTDIHISIPMRLRFLASNYGWGPIFINGIMFQIEPAGDGHWSEGYFTQKTLDNPVIIQAGETELVEFDYEVTLTIDNVAEAFKENAVWASHDGYMVMELSIRSTPSFQTPRLTPAFYMDIEKYEEQKLTRVYFKPMVLSLPDEILQTLPIEKYLEVEIYE